KLSSFPNSNHNMKLKVLENFNCKIYIQQIKVKAYHYLPQDFQLSLDLITQTNVEETRTLGHYNFIVQEALNLCAISSRLIKYIVTSLEQFSIYLIRLFHEITLSTKIIRYLVQYYSEIYLNYSFYSKNQVLKSKQSIFVLSTAPTLESLSTSTQELQTIVNNILVYIQDHDINISNITNTVNNSIYIITTSNPVFTAKIHDKMYYCNGFKDPEPHILDYNYVYDFELRSKN
ncbi:6699_t:CDS:2, partial [Scutellospora calospora]